MKIFITIFLLVLLLSSCKCLYYYSYNKNSSIIKENLFKLESQINSYPKGEIDELEVDIYYNDTLSCKVIRNTIKVYPIIEERKDTLKLNKEYASRFYFNFYKKWPEKVNISLHFDIDSQGIVKHESIFLKDLTLNKNCEYGFVPH